MRIVRIHAGASRVDLRALALPSTFWREMSSLFHSSRGSRVTASDGRILAASVRWSLFSSIVASMLTDETVGEKQCLVRAALMISPSSQMGLRNSDPFEHTADQNVAMI